MKRLASIFLTGCLIVLFSIVFARILHGMNEPLPPGDEPAVPSAAPKPTLSPADAVSDSELRFTVFDGGEIAELSMAEYLPCVLAGEMPASFEPEALRAQAVAARTYIMYCMKGRSQRHPEADVCSDASCCEAYTGQDELRELWGERYEEYWSKMVAAVVETDGQYLSYEGSPIQAVFHSSSGGRTEEGGALWSSIPYLVSVESPETAEDVPNFISSVEVTVEELTRTVQAVYPEAEFTGEPGQWIGEAELGRSGRVESLTLGGVSISGAELRAMFALRSTAFTLEFSGESFVFTVTGYGHGVGMSQYGANVMAKQGYGYDEILRHYYPNTVKEVA